VQVALGDSVLVGRASTRAGGVFAIRLPRAGRYRLQVSSLGYHSRISQAFDVPEGDTVDVVFSLAPEAIGLPGLDVVTEGGPVRAGRAEFEAHLARGKGVFVTRAQIDSLGPLEVGEIFKLVDGVRLNWEQATLDDGTRKMVPRIESRRGAGCLAYLLDGMPIVRSQSVNPWRVFPLVGLKVEDVEAIEVYRHMSEVPPELRNQAFVARDKRRVRIVPGIRGGTAGRVVTEIPREDACGVVVIRTRAAW